MSPFGAEVKRLREEKGLSQQALAELVGLTQGSIGHVETGRSAAVRAEILYKLCDALGVSADHFRPFLTVSESETPVTPPAPVKKSKKGK